LESVYSLSSISGLISPADYIDCAKWNPHNPEEFTIGPESTLIGLDTRSPTTTTTFIIPYAHDQCIRDFDYNPNKPYYLATGGNDGKKLYDIVDIPGKGKGMIAPTQIPVGKLILREAPAVSLLPGEKVFTKDF
ncbi:UNVERIFIED_CONTAM: Protein tssc1, partial [Siphonaria sp. JEL0065]